MTTDEIAVALHRSPTGGATALCIMRCKTHKFTKPASYPWEHFKKLFKEESRKVFEIKKLKKCSEVSLLFYSYICHAVYPTCFMLKQNKLISRAAKKTFLIER